MKLINLYFLIIQKKRKKTQKKNYYCKLTFIMQTNETFLRYMKKMTKKNINSLFFYKKAFRKNFHLYFCQKLFHYLPKLFDRIFFLIYI